MTSSTQTVSPATTAEYLKFYTDIDPASGIPPQYQALYEQILASKYLNQEQKNLIKESMLNINELYANNPCSNSIGRPLNLVNYLCQVAQQTAENLPPYYSYPTELTSIGGIGTALLYNALQDLSSITVDGVIHDYNQLETLFERFREFEIPFKAKELTVDQGTGQRLPLYTDEQIDAVSKLSEASRAIFIASINNDVNNLNIQIPKEWLGKVFNNPAIFNCYEKRNEETWCTFYSFLKSDFPYSNAGSGKEQRQERRCVYSYLSRVQEPVNPI